MASRLEPGLKQPIAGGRENEEKEKIMGCDEPTAMRIKILNS
jgi:hypothetical protein